MSWVLNAFYSSKPLTSCKAELRPATEDEIKAHSKPRSWGSYLDQAINCLCVPVLMSYRTIFGYVAKRSPEVGLTRIYADIFATKNPEVIKAVLLKHRNDPQNGVFSHAIVSKGLTDVFQQFYPKITTNDIILTCDPEHTEIFRKFLNQFFTPLSMKPYLEDIHTIISDICSKWGSPQQGIVVNKETKLLATAVMSQIFLGYAEPYDKVSAASTNTVLWTADNLMTTLSPVYRLGTYLLPFMAILSSKDKAETQKNLREAVDKALHQASQSDAKPSLVKEMVNKKFSQEQIQAMILTLFVAGQDNVSTSLSHILLKLAQSNELQAKVREDSQEPLQSKTLRGLICESLRVLCPVGGIGRTVAKPSLLTLTHPESGEVISTTLLTADANLNTMNQFVADDPSIYPNPEKFDIARHQNQSSFLPHMPHMPFGHGTHMCPGWYLYYAISAFTVAYIVNNFELSTSFEGEPKTKIRFVTQLAEDITVHFKNRKKTE